MLRGQFEVTIDDKGRLVMPSRCQSDFALKQDEQELIVEQAAEDTAEKVEGDKEDVKLRADEVRKIKGRLVVAPNLYSKKCLLIYPVDSWEEFERNWEERLSQDEYSKNVETLLGLVTPVDLDSKGRFAVPAYLIEHIGLKVKELSKSKFCLIGKKNRLELWKKELWDEQYRSANEAMEERQEIIKMHKEVEQVREKIKKEAAKEALKELMKEIKAGKEVMKEEIKAAILAGQENKAWDELVKGFQDFKM